MSALRALDRFDRRARSARGCTGSSSTARSTGRAPGRCAPRRRRPLPEPAGRRSRRGSATSSSRRSPTSGRSTAPSSCCATCSATRPARSRRCSSSRAAPSTRACDAPSTRSALALDAEAAMTREEIAELERALRGQAPGGGRGARAGAPDRPRRARGNRAAAANPPRRPLLWVAVRRRARRARPHLSATADRRAPSGASCAASEKCGSRTGPDAGQRARAARPRSGRSSPAPRACSSSSAAAPARLGRWDAATWSPAACSSLATSGRTLAALDPAEGAVRWRCGRGPSASRAGRPDRTHIAYRASHTLRIVRATATTTCRGARHGRRRARVAPGPRHTSPGRRRPS